MLCQGIPWHPWPLSLDTWTNLLRIWSEFPLWPCCVVLNIHPHEWRQELWHLKEQKWDFSLWSKWVPGGKLNRHWAKSWECCWTMFWHDVSVLDKLLKHSPSTLIFLLHFSVTQGFITDNCAVEPVVNCPWNAKVLSQTHQSSAHVELCPPNPVRWGQAWLTCACFNSDGFRINL